MASEEISLLSYTSNINAGQSYTSNGVILGQYISLSVVLKADQDLVVNFEFSGDGTNYDYTISKSVAAGANSILDTPVLAKWTRIKITNASVTNTTYLRFHCYGTPSNSSLIAQISKIGNYNPTVNVDNIPLSSNDSLLQTPSNLKFNCIWQLLTPGNIYPVTYVQPNTALSSYSSDNSGTVTVSNQCMRFGNSITDLEYGLMWGSMVSYKSTQSITATFSFGFLQQTKTVGDEPTTQWIGLGNRSSNLPYNFCGFGFDSSYGNFNTDDYDNWGIIYMHAGTKSFIPHTSFNVDRCDGTYHLPIIDVSLMQLGRIRYTFTGFGAIVFSIFDTTNNNWQVVHIMQFANDTPETANFSIPGLQMILYQTADVSTPLSSNEYIKSASFAINVEGENNVIDIPLCYSGVAAADIGSPAVAPFTNIVTVRNNTTWYSITNTTCIKLAYLSFKCNGTAECHAFAYKNAVLGGSPTYSSPYSDISPSSFTMLSSFLGGYEIINTVLQPTEGYRIDMTNYNIILSPGESISIGMYSSAASVVNCSIGVYNI
jgi:hypothetical protein